MNFVLNFPSSQSFVSLFCLECIPSTGICYKRTQGWPVLHHFLLSLYRFYATYSNALLHSWKSRRSKKAYPQRGMTHYNKKQALLLHQTRSPNLHTKNNNIKYSPRKTTTKILQLQNNNDRTTTAEQEKTNINNDNKWNKNHSHKTQRKIKNRQTIR